MNRRELVGRIGASVVASTVAFHTAFAASRREVAITMDDLALHGGDESVLRARNDSILRALREHSIKAAIFVTGANVDSPFGAEMLQAWNDAGHMLCNHTYSHRNCETTEFAEYTADILRCEQILRAYPRFRRFFRFPYLKEGKTAAQRDAVRRFLAEHGYRNGAVTIDASDWYVDDRLVKRLAQDPDAATGGYRDFYLQHILDRSNYYDDVSRRALGRSVRHTLLVHHNVLNGLFLGDILDQYVKQGWTPIDAEHAYADPVFRQNPDVVPAGDSLVLAIGVASGKVKRDRWPSEDGEYEAPAMDRLGL
ncbi:MAG TPA: polysaccharide deacetylase family protein [Steroidobacteraceae bacterium]|nr:polysaccharide deacetylase family protein [Steroidobacteraceae bacterium]